MDYSEWIKKERRIRLKEWLTDIDIEIEFWNFGLQA